MFHYKSLVGFLFRWSIGVLSTVSTIKEKWCFDQLVKMKEKVFFSSNSRELHSTIINYFQIMLLTLRNSKMQLWYRGTEIRYKTLFQVYFLKYLFDMVQLSKGSSCVLLRCWNLLTLDAKVEISRGIVCHVWRLLQRQVQNQHKKSWPALTWCRPFLVEVGLGRKLDQFIWMLSIKTSNSISFSCKIDYLIMKSFSIHFFWQIELSHPSIRESQGNCTTKQ